MKGQPENPPAPRFFSSTAALARALGLSRWAVSRALNGRGGVSEETVRRVREAVESAGYAPSLLGRGLRSGGSGLAGIALPDPEGYHLAGKVGLLAGAMEEEGWRPVFRLTDGGEAAERAALGVFGAVRCGVVAVFAARLGAGDPACAGLLAGGVRMVHIDPVSTGLGIPAVWLDRRRAMALLIEHAHALGHRAACVAGIQEAGTYGKARWEGLRSTARRLGWPRPPKPLGVVEAGDEFAEGAALCRIFQQLGRARPPFVVARNDRVAFGFLAAARQLGLRCPEDFSLAGYDASPIATHADPAITTVDARPARLVGAVAGILARRDSPAGPVPRRILPALRPGGSTGPPPGKIRSSPRAAVRV